MSAPYRVSDASVSGTEAETQLYGSLTPAQQLRALAAARLAARRAGRPEAATQAAVPDVARLDARVPGAARALAAVAARYGTPRAAEPAALPPLAMTPATAQPTGAEAASLPPAVAQAAVPQSRAAALHAALDEVLNAPPVVAAVAVESVAEPMPSRPLVAVPPTPQPAWTEAQAELHALEEELAFRLDPSLDPTFAEHLLEPLPVPANLIHFPRALVAARKARPRLAEGPLREASEPEVPQLQIFELEPEQIATAPDAVGLAAVAGTASPVAPWQEFVLPAQPSAPQAAAEPLLAVATAEVAPVAAYNPARSAIYTQPAQLAPLQSAPLGRRMMSAAVDGCAVLFGWTGFLCVATLAAGAWLTQLAVPLLVALSAVALLALYAAYYLLFFTLANATPGMRYAQLELCTFDGQRPLRRQLQRRILVTLVAAAPLGLGLLWMLMDYDHLGWHDRLSKVYPREN